MSRVDRASATTASYPVATVLAITAAAGLVPLNSTMIAVALPTIATDFGISTGTVSVLITVYLVAMLVGQPIAGRISDIIGNRRAVTLALVGMIVTSCAGALAPTFVLLVVARLAQALCAAALGPSVQALLRSVTPLDQQGRAFGLMGVVLGVGAASGPVVGGVLTQVAGWEAIFLVNVPIAAGALIAARRANVASRGVRELTSPDAVVSDGRILNRTFVSCFSVQALSTIAQYALLLLTPIILAARGWASGSIGLVLSALTVGMIVVGPAGGRAGDRYGRRRPIGLGLLVATSATVALFVAGSSVAVGLLVVALAVFGLGLGAATPNLMSSALESVPMNRTGSAAGVLSTSRYVGSLTTSLVVAAVVTADADGTQGVLALSSVAMVGAVIVASRLPSTSAAAGPPPE